MYIELPCSSCGLSSPVSYVQLCRLWKQEYAKLPPEEKKNALATTTVRCSCGHVDHYDSPMFRYVFQLVFDEFVKERITS